MWSKTNMIYIYTYNFSESCLTLYDNCISLYKKYTVRWCLISFILTRFAFVSPTFMFCWQNEINKTQFFFSNYNLLFLGLYLCDLLAGIPLPVISLLPFIKGTKTSGTTMFPFFCWYFSAIAIIVLGTAHAVPFNVWTCNTFPSALSYLMFNLLDW